MRRVCFGEQMFRKDNRALDIDLYSIISFLCVMEVVGQSNFIRSPIIVDVGNCSHTRLVHVSRAMKHSMPGADSLYYTAHGRLIGNVSCMERNFGVRIEGSNGRCDFLKLRFTTSDEDKLARTSGRKTYGALTTDSTALDFHCKLWAPLQPFSCDSQRQ